MQELIEKKQRRFEEDFAFLKESNGNIYRAVDLYQRQQRDELVEEFKLMVSRVKITKVSGYQLGERVEEFMQELTEEIKKEILRNICKN